jgi:hypothetical protein
LIAVGNCITKIAPEPITLAGDILEAGMPELVHPTHLSQYPAAVRVGEERHHRPR